MKVPMVPGLTVDLEKKHQHMFTNSGLYNSAILCFRAESCPLMPDIWFHPDPDNLSNGSDSVIYVPGGEQ